jgi:hypothetical protein
VSVSSLTIASLIPDIKSSLSRAVTGHAPLRRLSLARAGGAGTRGSKQQSWVERQSPPSTRRRSSRGAPPRPCRTKAAARRAWRTARAEPRYYLPPPWAPPSSMLRRRSRRRGGGGRRTRFVARLRRVHAVQRRIPQARDAAHALSVQFPHEPPLGVLVVEARGEQVFAGRWHGGWVDGRWEVSTGYVSYSSPTQVEERSATSHLGWGSQ